MRVTKSNFYSIAGILLEIEVDERYLQKELSDFVFTFDQSTGEAIPDVTISVSTEEYGGNLQGKVILKGSLLTITEGEDSFFVTYNMPTCVSGYELSKSAKRAVIYLTKEAINHGTHQNMDELEELEELKYAIRDAFFYYLQQYDRIVVHSASFVYHDVVWLFSAPSGTGKSTHVELWKKNGYTIQDFNGDLAVCYMDENGNAVAAGIPWCGTSGIYVNRTAPLGGILFLQRSCTDLAVPLSELQGTLHLLARCVTPSWTKKQADLNATIAEKIASKAHLAILYCTKKDSAAKVSKEYIDKVSH
ncbi:MAG TPA: hypothetical protein VJY54_14140 [Lachnospiraceae bacterium]|nr:hypothetical protein [Lachnospiraceae bacterium]